MRIIWTLRAWHMQWTRLYITKDYTMIFSGGTVITVSTHLMRAQILMKYVDFVHCSMIKRFLEKCPCTKIYLVSGILNLMKKIRKYGQTLIGPISLTNDEHCNTRVPALKAVLYKMRLFFSFLYPLISTGIFIIQYVPKNSCFCFSDICRYLLLHMI